MRLRRLGALGFALAAAACDGGLQPEPVCGPGFVGACGTARFSGTPPATSDTVYLVAFPTFPQTCADLLVFPPTFRPFPPFQLSPPFGDSVAYGLRIPPDQYAWLVAVWKDTGAVTFTVADTAIFRLAGDYRNPADTALRGAVTVPSGGAVGDVNLVVDFDNLRPVPEVVACGGP